MKKQTVTRKNKVSVELQTILDHLTGPAPRERIDSFINENLDKSYIRGTWYNSCYYLQNDNGEWFLAYPHVDVRTSFIYG